MKYLELPMTFRTIVSKSLNVPNCVFIDQPDGDDESTPMPVVLHRSQVDDVIAALQRFMAEDE